MKIVSISDIHIKSQEDAGYKILKTFFNHKDTLSADYIFLLGDIFDLMVGPHSQYLKQFPDFFKECTDIIKKNKKLYFVEGNHDVHLRELFYKTFKGEKIKFENNFIISQKPIKLSIEEKNYIFSHGDEYDVENSNYQNYKNLIYKPYMRFIGEKIVPYSLINFLGTRASAISRKKGKKTFDREKVRLKIRKGVEFLIKDNANFVIGGHSHVLDQYQMKNGGTYINNGFPLEDKKFILIEDGNFKFVDL